MLRLLEVSQFTFGSVDETSSLFGWLEQMMGWTTESLTYTSMAYFTSQLKRRHWLLASSAIDEAAFAEWLPTPECGSSAQSELRDTTAISCGVLIGGDAGEQTPPLLFVECDFAFC